MIDREVLAVLRLDVAGVQVEVSATTTIRELPDLLAAVRTLVGGNGQAPVATVAAQPGVAAAGREGLLDELRSTYVALRRAGKLSESAAPTRGRVAQMSESELASLLAEWRKLEV